jgi:hypothetical protein
MKNLLESLRSLARSLTSGKQILTSGLEKHLTEILDDAGIERSRYDFDWSDIPGITVSTPKDADALMKVIDASREIGPTRWNRRKKKIELGTHESLFKSTTDAKTMTFDEYVKKFKNFEVD